MGLIRTLLIIGLLYYLSKIILRLFAPQITNYAAKKMNEKMNEKFNQQYNSTQEEKIQDEGKTTIVNKPRKSSNLNTDSEGEYIDFEDVD